MANHAKTGASFIQPTGHFKERIITNAEETIEYLPGYKYRIWHNNQFSDYASHTHPAIEIIICKVNVYTVIINEETYRLKEGDILFIPPNSPHSLSAPETGERFILLFDTKFFESFRDASEISAFFASPHLLTMNSDPHLYPFVYSSLSKIIQIYFANENLSEIAIYSEALKTINLLCGSIHDESKDEITVHSDIYDKFVNVLSYIDNNYSEDLTLNSVADTTGFSKFHFSRLFKQYTNTTFYDYLCTRRVNVAKQLLKSSIPVTEFAFRTGFNNLTTFCRCFKKYVGCSPSQYRSSIARDENMEFNEPGLQSK